MTLVLVTGGVRSGKSALAERLFDPTAPIRYVATGPDRDDADWAERVREHQRRRPPAWSSVGTLDVPVALADAPAGALIDCLGTWLTGVLDGLGAWDAPRGAWEAEYGRRATALVDAMQQSMVDLVVVTNEVGWGLVSEHRSGRIFADELGRLNQRVAAAADAVLLCVSGQVLPVKGSAPLPGTLGAGRRDA
ncbi:bifunctional adenosylcobinamide kinase/adenosylcobinamide-phosphate guanylyltransferase [Flexivirga sp. ID2601S]|uniref:Adenosylcobinamide kinase n=1 Tax=Flexivirga aerilata TaxID=1656889 RepID=A0A849AK75_9MICO|nr:bifunctional adenosylcobinamide kinase/adenosylcobinamide-phosphate guanylyltransferase [Flexivirga aerilata]NNG40433.1 bifunctional adenosylcobinamide kinase/adenosylcobinamide-phosphate guanylyltransferase [Flexivirga aerilata]